MNAVTLKNVSYYYPGEENTPAIRGVDLSIERGEFICVLGHNGSGKSTLARLINGLICADKGEVSVFGMDVSSSKNTFEVRKRVGIVFQNPDNQMVASIVEDDVAFGPENIGVPREEIAKRIDWALEVVGMQKYRNGTPTKLSGGQKQRIAIAGVLAIKPDVLILDESTAMLDPRGRKEVMEVVKKLNREEGMTIINITHFMEEALIADRALVLNKGEVVMQGTPKEIFSKGDMLETFNLCLPTISVIKNALCGVGMNLEDTLYPTELGSSIAAQCLQKGINSIVCPQHISQVSEGGEWDITCKNLTFTYSKKSPFAKKALDDVNLTIPEGQFFGIIGHTGSGKSTFVQHLNALIKLPQAEKKYKAQKIKKGEIPPTMPQLTIGRFNLAEKGCDFISLRANVGMVFQYPEYQLFAEKVFDDVAFGLKNFKKGMTEEEIECAVKDAIEMVGLSYEEVKDKSPFELSGGQKRRVAIAGVVVTKPSILVLDEPAAGLDPLGKKEIMELLHKLHKTWCKTVIFVSHDMDEIAENCTSVAVFAEGKCVKVESPQTLFKDYNALLELGLDIPLPLKVACAMIDSGVNIECNCTTDCFIDAITKAYIGGNNV